MALEAVVFSEGFFGYGGGGWSNNHHSNNIHHTAWDSYSSYSSPTPSIIPAPPPPPPPPPSSTEASTCRRKRRRTKSAKNKEEIENQRMTHITVERNRRKQMNEYLAVLRSLMPSSYVQRGDQASIIGGAINFVKELEQVVQSMEGERRKKKEENVNSSSAFESFLTFPQYRMARGEGKGEVGVADIEVTMVDTHANLKILSKKRNGQLIKLVIGLQSLSLSILHLNVTTLPHLVLYSVSLKVEEGSELNTVDEIAAAVNQLLRSNQRLLTSFN